MLPSIFAFRVHRNDPSGIQSMMRHTASLLVVAVLASQASAAQRWKYEESVDDINGTKVRTVAVIGENPSSALVLRVEEGKKPILTLHPGLVMFPDETDMESNTMGIAVTMRSTVMEKPITEMFRMPWMEYKVASVSCGKDSAVNKVFAGDSVTFQLDKVGKRFKFPTKGEGLEGLQEAVAKAVEIAAADAPTDGKK